MKTVLRLVGKDLLRDARHPWSLVVLMILPVLTAVLVAMVFSPDADGEGVTIHVAVLDRDDDLLSSMLRSVIGFSLVVFGMQLNDLLLYNGDNIIIGFFLSAAAVTPFALAA